MAASATVGRPSFARMACTAFDARTARDSSTATPPRTATDDALMMKSRRSTAWRSWALMVPLDCLRAALRCCAVLGAGPFFTGSAALAAATFSPATHSATAAGTRSRSSVTPIMARPTPSSTCGPGLPLLRRPAAVAAAASATTPMSP